MKRYVCTAAAGLLLVLASTGTASASGLPELGGVQEATQSSSFGDQTVGEQTNDADLTQAQGNGNVNIAPAVAVFGDAKTTNYQGNGNTADASVTQSNDVTQSQSATQTQDLSQQGDACCEPMEKTRYGKPEHGSKDGCCDGQSQTGEQKTSFGDQTVGKQQNDADVTQKQGHGNVNIAPAVAIFGDAETTNKQGNGNTTTADVDQSNSVDQSQSSYQRQSLGQSGGRGKDGCCDGQSQAGTQHVYGGDQTVDKQKNEADVSQYQGNGNVNIATAVAVFGDAKTENKQGNGNTADASVTQSNDVTQSQSSKQKQHLSQDGSGCCEPKSDDKPKHDGERKKDCCDGSSQTGERKTSFGDQTVGKQRNDADVTQKQGSGNVNVSPAIGVGGKKHGKCGSKCDRKGHGGHGAGDASTRNAQGNGNTATAEVDQSNAVEQSQRAFQYQRLVDACEEVMSR